MTTAAIIVAAGRGRRAGGALPKQWQTLGDRPVAAYAMARFAAHPAITQLILVLHPDDIDTELWPREPAATIATGGATRAASVLAGLRAVAAGIDRVLIHDAARPLVSDALIDRVVAALDHNSGAAPALAVTHVFGELLVCDLAVAIGINRSESLGGPLGILLGAFTAGEFLLADRAVAVLVEVLEQLLWIVTLALGLLISLGKTDGTCKGKDSDDVDCGFH